MILIVFYNSHRSVPYSDIIGEPSSCRRHKQNKDPQLESKQRDLGTPNSKWEASIKSQPSQLRDSLGRGGIKSIRARGYGGHQDITSTEERSHEFTVSGRVRIRPTTVCKKSSAYILMLSV